MRNISIVKIKINIENMHICLNETKWYDNNKILQFLQENINLYLASWIYYFNNGFVVGNCYLQKNKLYL